MSKHCLLFPTNQRTFTIQISFVVILYAVFNCWSPQQSFQQEQEAKMKLQQ